MPITSKDDPTLSRWQWRIFAGTWITYFSVYFCRQNFGVANASTMAGELHFTNTQMGLIASALTISYGFGQFINGQLADRFGARKLLAIGMFTSTLLNFAFGFSSVLWMLVLLWTLNGYFQSMCWPSCVKVMANWFPVHLRGKAMGLMGTSYQFGAAATFFFAAWLVDRFGWRSAFIGPAFVLLAAGLAMILLLRSKPQDAGLPPVHSPLISATTGQEESETLSIAKTVVGVLSNRNLWIVALAFMGLDIIRYGFMNWAIKFLSQTSGDTVFLSSVKNAILPLGGALGAVVAGWLTDRYFHSRRAPVVSAMLLLLGVFTLFYNYVVQAGNTWVILFTLFLIGFMTYGPHVLMVGACPQDFGTRRMAASAAGFIDCMGYMGATVVGVGTGYLLDHYSWQIAIWAWAGAAFIAAALMATLWNVKVSRE